MLEVLTLITFSTLYKVLSQALDHELVLPVDLSGQPLKHSLLGAVDLNQAMEPRLLSPVDPLQHALEPRLFGHVRVHLRAGLTHDDLPPDDGGQPPPRPDGVAQLRPPPDVGQPPPPPDDGWAQGKGTFFVFPSVPLARMDRGSAMTTSRCFQHSPLLCCGATYSAHLKLSRQLVHCRSSTLQSYFCVNFLSRSEL